MSAHSPHLAIAADHPVGGAGIQPRDAEENRGTIDRLGRAGGHDP